MESFVAIYRKFLKHYTEMTLGVHIAMSHTDGRSKPFGPSVLCIDDKFDVLELERSIRKRSGLRDWGATGPGRRQDG
jgi:hypothetical protein